jgi:hypothetical protein
MRLRGSLLLSPTVAFVAALVPSAALAAVPRIIGAPVVENPSFDGIENTMMYDVTVTVDGLGSDPAHTAVVGYLPDDEYTTCNAVAAWKWSPSQAFDTADTRTFRLYNFQPGTLYHYKVLVGTGPHRRARCGILETAAAPTPTLPTSLDDLNIDFAKAGRAHRFESKYVLLETDDCGASGVSISGATDYLIVVDPVNETIVWYLDIPATAGARSDASTSGFRYQPGPTATSGRILATVSRRYLFEWTFAGTTVQSYDVGPNECDGGPGADGPCFHHDAFKSDETGNTYVLASGLSSIEATGTPWEPHCYADTPFIDDGFRVFDDSGTLSIERSLIADYGYDPTVDPGPHAGLLVARPGPCNPAFWNTTFDDPHGMIDWMHSNSITASKFGRAELVDVSLKEWDQVLRFNANTGALVWRLSANPPDTDWGTITNAPGVVGAEQFAGQHDVQAIGANTLLMFDNLGDSAGSRALQIHLDAPTSSATIEKAWAVVNHFGTPLRCGFEGTAQQVPGGTEDHVVTMCADSFSVAELDDPTGASGNPPPLVISLPEEPRGPFCLAGGPVDRMHIRGWHRAFPMATVGDF